MNKELKFNKTGSRMLVDTGFKEFDKQTNLITSGNVIANTQLSSYIRSKEETYCNFNYFERGELRNYDLTQYLKYLKPHQLVEILKETKDKKVILYMFFIRRKGMIDPIGFVLTDEKRKKIIRYSLNRHSEKRLKCIKSLFEYILDDDKGKVINDEIKFNSN